MDIADERERLVRLAWSPVPRLHPFNDPSEQVRNPVNSITILVLRCTETYRKSEYKIPSVLSPKRHVQS